MTWTQAQASWKDWLREQRFYGSWKDSPDVMQFLDWAIKHL